MHLRPINISNEPIVIPATQVVMNQGLSPELLQNRMANLNRPTGVDLDPRKQSIDASLVDNHHRNKNSSIFYNNTKDVSPGLPPN